jgi:hypothetical protein
MWLGRNAQKHQDANILIMADAPVPLGDAALALYLDNLKLHCQQLFLQDIVWITVHSVTRVDANDFVI